MWIKRKCDDFLITGKGFGTVEDLLVSFMDSIKVTYYNDAHGLIISDSMRCREYSDWFGFASYVAQ
jgi:hypothetical protein